MNPEWQKLGEIKENEHHPSADGAYAWLKKLMKNEPAKYIAMKQIIYELADVGENRTFLIMRSTIERLAHGEPVSDRYLLGLCWFLRELADGAKNDE